MNRRLIDAASQANDGSGCDASELYDEIYEKIGTNPIGLFEQYAENLNVLERIPGSWNPSNDPIGIYNGISIWASLGIGLTGTASVISANGFRVGTDKFGHFASQGKDYFDAFLETRSIEEAYKTGWNQENGIYGLWGSGVLSYGDLSANYAGFLFWLNILNGPEPYYTCQKGEFVLNHKFTWADYIHYGWDETINCSEYTPEVKKIVDKNKIENSYSCTISKNACKEIAKYNCAKYFISPSCREYVTEEEMSCRPDKIFERPYFSTDEETSAIIEVEIKLALEQNAMNLKIRKTWEGMRALSLPIRQSL